jgi:hypothetical protein
MIWDDSPDKFCNGKDGRRCIDSNLESKVGTGQLMRHFIHTFNNRKMTTNAKDFGTDVGRYVKDKRLPFERS